MKQSRSAEVQQPKVPQKLSPESKKQKAKSWNKKQKTCNQKVMKERHTKCCFLSRHNDDINIELYGRSRKEGETI